MEDEPKDVCPYDRSHHIFRSRMPYHMMRCAKNFPNVKKKNCPYDTRHMVDPKEYFNHISTCPSREYSLQCTRVEENSQNQQQGLPIQPLVPLNHPLIERWEDDFDEQGSVLQSIQNQNSKNQLFASPLIGGSKGQRKKHRITQRRLHQQAYDSKQKENKVQQMNAVHSENNTSKQDAQSRLNVPKTTTELGNVSAQIEPERKPVVSSVTLDPENLNISGLAINDSNATKRNEKSKIQDSAVAWKTHPKGNSFSYAAALNSSKKM